MSVPGKSESHSQKKQQFKIIHTGWKDKKLLYIYQAKRLLLADSSQRAKWWLYWLLTLDTLEALLGLCKPHVVGSRTWWTEGFNGWKQVSSRLFVNCSFQVLNIVVFFFVPQQQEKREILKVFLGGDHEVEVVVFSSEQCTWKRFSVIQNHSARKHGCLLGCCGEGAIEIFLGPGVRAAPRDLRVKAGPFRFQGHRDSWSYCQIGGDHLINKISEFINMQTLGMSRESECCTV